MKFLITILFALPAQDISIEELIRGWRYEDPAVRQAVTDTILSRWQAWSAAELAALAAAEADADQEVAARAGFVLARISLRRKLGAKILEKIPGLDDAFHGGAEERRLELLKRLTALWKEGVVNDAALERVARIARDGRWRTCALNLIVHCRENKVAPLGPMMASFLKHPVQEVRSNAADTIGALGLKAYAKDLVPLLADDEGDLHWEVADALFMLEAREQAPKVLPFLRHGSPGVRENAVRLLGQLEIRSAVSAVAKLLDDPNRSVRVETLRTLGKLGAAAYADRVAPYLGDDDPEVRTIAVTALGHMKAKRLADRMAPLLEDSETKVRLAATYAVGTLRLPAHGKGLAARLKDSDAEVREAAVTVLGWLGDPAYVEEVAVCLDDESESVQIGAVETLAELGAKAYAARMVPFLSHSLYTYRLAALESIRKLDAWELSGKLLPLIGDPVDSVQYRAVEALGALGVGHGEGLIPFLEDQDFVVQLRVSVELEKVASEGVLEKIHPLLKHPRVNVRLMAACVVCGRATADQADVLLPLLKDSDSNIRIHAFEALGRVGSREHLPKLRSGLEDEEELVRLYAAVGLSVAESRLLSEEGRKRAAARLENLLLVEIAPERRVKTALLSLGRMDRAAQLRFLESYGEDPEEISPLTDLMDAVARVHEPDAYGRLDRMLLAEKRVATWEDLRTLLSGAGLHLDVADDEFFRRRLPAGTRITVRQTLLRCFDDGRANIVLDGNRVRILSRLDALKHWKKRLDGK